MKSKVKIGCLLLLLNNIFGISCYTQSYNFVTNGNFEDAPLYWDTLNITEQNFSIITQINKWELSNLYGWSSCVSPRGTGWGTGGFYDTCCDKILPNLNPNSNYLNRPSYYFNLNVLKDTNFKYLLPSHTVYGNRDVVSHLSSRAPQRALTGRNVGFISLEDMMVSEPSEANLYQRSLAPPLEGNMGYYSYMTNTLKEPLKKGKRYKIGFFAGIDNWIDTTNIPQEPYLTLTMPNNVTAFEHINKKNDSMYVSYLTDGLGILLGKNDLVCYAKGNGNPKYPMSQYPPQFRISSPHMSKGEWVEYSWDFVADTDYETMTIGNFWDTSQQNLIRWKFDYYSKFKEVILKHNESMNQSPETQWWRYRYLYMYMFIDSVYLYEIGSYLPDDTTVCWGETIQIKEGLGREVLWYREDGSSFTSDFFEVIANKDSTRVVAFVDGEYDTMYVFGKKTAPYTLNHTDSLCSYQVRPFNRFEINSTETGLQATWLQNGILSDGLSFLTSVLGSIDVTIIDSVGCIQTQNIESELFCICPVLPPDTILCLQEEIIIRDLIGCELTWILEDGSEQQSDSFRLVVSNPLHTVVARSTEGIFDTMIVQGKQVPDYSIYHTDSLCHYTRKEFNQLQLLIEEQGVSVFWQLNGNQFSGLDFKSSDTGILFLTIQDSVGCAYKDTFYLGEYCPEFSDVCAFPNAFSPNGDGLNDVLVLDCVNISSVQITILNRWGEVIAMSSDYNHVWDGSFKGNPCPNGVYTLIIQYEAYNQPGKKLYYSGTLTLVR